MTRIRSVLCAVYRWLTRGHVCRVCLATWVGPNGLVCDACTDTAMTNATRDDNAHLIYR